ncbi:lysis system i-spanin subunit Rz [Azonexus sp.]|uniref:lysis system i-spanin subunit Rz n=1 Tax=Azonexus sp. TaxID=1872668 RepID=UPI0027B8A7CF|nr:lysis system i-spanin subunit Rz [Azonexus sp.]
MKVIPVWIPIVLILVLFAGLGFAIYGYGLVQFEQGKKAERTTWQQRENAELTAANARILELTAEARQAEQGHAAALAKASATYQENLQHEKATRDRTIADLRSGALRLRIELASRETAGGGAAGEGESSAGRCDGETHGELSPAAAEFLVDLASEADDVVHQLNAAQAVIAACEYLNQGARK